MKTETAGQVAATKQEICALLRAFVNQRPGLEFANYGCATSYRAELRSITKQRADALQLLRAVELRESISAEDLIAPFQTAFSGRLSLVEIKGNPALEYYAGQYYPTEYRAAACAVLARCLWVWVRTDCMPEGVKDGNGEVYGPKKLSAGGFIRDFFKREFGRGIQGRWFN